MSSSATATQRSRKGIERSAIGAIVRAQNSEHFSGSADPNIRALPGTTWTNKAIEKVEQETDANLAASTYLGLILLDKLLTRDSVALESREQISEASHSPTL